MSYGLLFAAIDYWTGLSRAPDISTYSTLVRLSFFDNTVDPDQLASDEAS